MLVATRARMDDRPYPTPERMVNMKRLALFSILFILLVTTACFDSTDMENLTARIPDDTSTPIDDHTGDEEADPPGSAPDKSTLMTRVDVTPPPATVRICFIHHSTGSAWIATGNGNLGTALNDNNYYVTEIDYGWDATAETDIGSHTDTRDWPRWFTDTIMPDVYDNDAHFDYTNAISDPGGENQIIMFKSCYPNSEVGASIEDEQQIYLDMLDYFAEHQDKLFILIVPPPEIVISSDLLTRELANWLVDYENGWLSEYPYFNVHSFDYYNVLTDPENHHRVEAASIVHTVSSSPVDGGHPNELYYYTGTNNHPTSDGHRKATQEYVPLLNAYYNLWRKYR